MGDHAHFPDEEVRRAGERIGIDLVASPFDVEQYRTGMDVELEHGTQDLETDVTDDDATVTAKIARAISMSSRTATRAWPSWRPKRRPTGPRRQVAPIRATIGGRLLLTAQPARCGAGLSKAAGGPLPMIGVKFERRSPCR
jgi:hypothetical protein